MVMWCLSLNASVSLRVRRICSSIVGSQNKETDTAKRTSDFLATCQKDETDSILNSDLFYGWF